MRRIQPRCSSRSSVAVMVAEATRTRSLTCEGVSGARAPSMTASAVAASCGMSKVSRMRRSSSPSRASPVRHNDAYASVQVGSPSGYSSAKSASTVTTPSEAGEGRLPLPGLSAWLGSDIREDLDSRGALDPGLLHSRAQGRVVSEAARLLGAGEVMGDEQVITIIGQAHHALPGAAVQGPHGLEFVVDLPPCGVVLDVVPAGPFAGPAGPAGRSADLLRGRTAEELVAAPVRATVHHRLDRVLVGGTAARRDVDGRDAVEIGKAAGQVRLVVDEPLVARMGPAVGGVQAAAHLVCRRAGIGEAGVDLSAPPDPVDLVGDPAGEQAPGVVAEPDPRP